MSLHPAVAMPDVPAFVAVAALIVVVPGPDMALILRNGLATGRRSALLTALGINAGLVVWALAAALGLAALVRASAEAFTALKLVGAVYLVWLGVHTLHDAWRGEPANGPHLERADSSPFRQGVLTNLLNPKVALVYTTFIPQFVEPGSSAPLQTLVLAAVFVTMGLVWLIAYALLIARIGGALRRPLVRRLVSTASGALLTMFGMRLALARVDRA